MNKKGILPVIPILILIFGIIAIITFFYSSTWKYTFLGIGILLIFFFMLFNFVQTPMSKGKVIGLGVVLIVGMIFVLGAGYLQSFYNPCGSVASISPTTITLADSPTLNKKVIRVTYSTVPNQECLNINLNPSIVNSKLNEAGISGFTATKNVVGSIELLDSQKIYNIYENSNQKVRDLIITPISLDTFEMCSIERCKIKGYSNTIRAYKTKTIGGCNCIQYKEIGNNAEFQSSVQYKWRTVVTISGQNVALTPEKTSGTIGNLATVKWIGNFVSNDGLDSINRDAYKPYLDNQFRMVEKNMYSFLNKEYQYTLDYIDNTCSAVVCPEAITRANSYSSMVKTKTSNILSDWENQESMVKDASVLNNKLYVNLQSPITYPVFTVDIDASSVGILISTGKPQVSCPSSIPTIDSGSLYNTNIQISNIGENRGSFNYQIECDKGSQTLSPSPPISLNKGESKSISASLGLTVSEGQDTSKCKFTLMETNTLETKSCNFVYTAQHVSSCTVGTKTCELGNSELWTCLSDGSYDKVKCEFGCIVENNVAKCRTKSICEIDPNDPSCIIPPTCAWYETGYIKEQKDYGPMYWRAFINKPIVTSTPSCKISNWVWLLGGFMIITSIIIYTIKLPTTNKRRR